jgi:hypothetical protein
MDLSPISTDTATPTALPPCFQPINTEWFNAITLQLGAVTTGTELQNLVNQAFGTIGLVNSTIEGQIALLAPLNALLTAPEADPTKIVTWITSFITDFLTPYLMPYTKMALQLTDIAAQVTTLTAAAHAAASELGVTITIPPVAAFCSI